MKNDPHKPKNVTTWGDARDVGAGSHHHHQDLATAWPLWLLAKREWGCAKTVFGCISRGCANTQDWEKNKKERKNEKRERKKKEKRTHCEPIHWLHGTDSSMLGVSLWVEGRGRSCADHRPCAETVGGTCMGDICDVGASSHCCQDLAMVWQLYLLAR